MSPENPPTDGSDLRLRLTVFIGLVAIVLISYHRILLELWGVWLNDPDAGHGVLVPWLALYLAWQRRKQLTLNLARPSWVGLLVLLFALVPHAVGTWWGMPYLDRLSVIISIWGAAIVAFGFRAALRVTVPIAFLIFALPLPGRFQTMLAGPLQSLAARATDYLLIASGVPATRAGNIIVVHDYQIAVAEACNGLRMLLAYVMICTFFAMAIRNIWWERLLMVIAAIPVALAANVIRIYATALMVIFVNEEAAGDFFHDIAGYVMMPVAVIMLLVWLWIIRKVYPEDLEGAEIAKLDVVSTVAMGEKQK